MCALLPVPKFTMVDNAKKKKKEKANILFRLVHMNIGHSDAHAMWNSCGFANVRTGRSLW